MKKYKHLLWSDIPKDTAEKLIQEMQFISQLYTIALLKVFIDRNGRKNVLHIGSGTLVSIGDIYGILTAHHVAHELENDNRLGLVIGREGQEHEFTIPVVNLHIIDIGIPRTEEYGPDLSFIKLPINKIDTIKATKQFFPILRYKEQALQDINPVTGFWCACGSPEVMTKVEDSQIFDKALSLCIYCGIGGVPSYGDKDEWDYCEITIDYNQDDLIPKKFNGVSGGGFWQMVISSDTNNPLKIEDHILSGVIFWQSERDDNKRNLRCHSRKSIYQKMVDLVQVKHN